MYFDTTKDAVLKGYVYQVGLVAVWLQNGMSAKVRYAIIEREMLGIVCVCVFEIPLLLTWQKVCMQMRLLVSRKVHFLLDAPPCLQRVLLTIQPYDFEIKYIPGKEVALADAVSRINPQDEMELKGLDFTLHEVTQCMIPIQISMVMDVSHSV